jgi:kynurenine formamidase
MSIVYKWSSFMKMIDLSVPTEDSPSESIKVEVNFIDHGGGAQYLCSQFACQLGDLPEGKGSAAEILRISSHAGTHIDAPYHYFPTSEGKRAKTIDELPLEWFYSDGVVIDMRKKEKGAIVTTSDIMTQLKKIHYKIKPLDIVLLQTGSDKLWGKSEYFDAGCGLDRDSTLWLINQGVKVIGTDSWGLDRPFWAIKQEFESTHNKFILWQSHFAGIEKEYCQIEKLANLDQLPKPFGFKVICIPVKINKAGAGWCRAVAVFDNAL